MTPEDMEKTAEDADRLVRRFNMRAMRYTGWRRRFFLWMARIQDRAGSELRDAAAQERRGKNDNYHDEY